MAEGKQNDSWNHTSALLALIANVNRDAKKQRALKPDDLHPMRSKGGEVIPDSKLGFSMMKKVFVEEETK